MENKIYLGQYKNDNILIMYNQIRYKTYCIILDQLCYNNSLTRVEEINRTVIENYIFKLIKRNKRNEAIVNTAIGSMLMSGLISEHNNNFKLTPIGINAYREQTYHLIVANLTEAKASRIISEVAIIISLVSISITIVSL